MDFNNYSNIVDDRARELERSRVMPFLMRKVYTWMALALTITAIVAYGIGNSPGLLMSLFGSKMPMLVLFAAEIGLVIGCRPASAASRSPRLPWASSPSPSSTV